MSGGPCETHRLSLAVQVELYQREVVVTTTPLMCMCFQTPERMAALKAMCTAFLSGVTAVVTEALPVMPGRIVDLSCDRNDEHDHARCNAERLDILNRPPGRQG